MNAEPDTATPQQVKDVQEAGLRAQIAHVAAHSPFYKSLFKLHGIDPTSIRSLEDLQLFQHLQHAHMRQTAGAAT